MRICSGLQILWCLPLLSNAKVTTGKFQLSGAAPDELVHYMSHFGCAIGTCNYKVRAWVKDPMSPFSPANKIYFANSTNDLNKAILESSAVKTKLRVMLDEEWSFSHSKADCQRVTHARGTLTLRVSLTGDPGDWVTGSIEQKMRPHFWYFLLDDCKNDLLSHYSHLSGVPVPHLGSIDVDFEILFHQVDGSGVSVEHVGMTKWVVLQVAVNVLILGYTLNRQHKIMKRQEFNLHLMPQVINFSLISSIFGSTLHLVYLSKLSNHATGILLDTASEIFIQLSQVAISSGIILIGFGVTLNVQQRISMEVGLLVFLCIGVMHIIFVVVDKATTDPNYKHYSLDGNVGWAICTCRLALWIYFLYGWQGNVTSGNTPPATTQFLRKVLVPASLYLLSFPLLFIALRVVPAYFRHSVLYNGAFVVQCSAILMLAETFMRKGEYFKVSTMSQSFLPGGVWRPPHVHYA